MSNKRSFYQLFFAEELDTTVKGTAEARNYRNMIPRHIRLKTLSDPCHSDVHKSSKLISILKYFLLPKLFASVSNPLLQLQCIECGLC